VSVSADSAISDDNISLSAEHWRDQPTDVFADVLSIGISVHDDVGSGPEG
jgi:hypothetical protein